MKRSQWFIQDWDDAVAELETKCWAGQVERNTQNLFWNAPLQWTLVIDQILVFPLVTKSGDT